MEKCQAEVTLVDEFHRTDRDVGGGGQYKG